MKYNIAAIADLHWEEINPEIMYRNLEQFTYFISKMDIDLVVILGDYFSSRLPLNSNITFLSVSWMHNLIEVCKKSSVKKIRIIKGTSSHDYDQLSIFKTYEESDGFFRIFEKNTYEETLPGLKAIYCPDENIVLSEYKELYLENMSRDINIGFFHGNFDVVLPPFIADKYLNDEVKNVIFELNLWEKIVNGPLLAGHWHNSDHIRDLFYVGSFERWEFDEDNMKGFGFLNYDTDTHKYYYHLVPNIFTDDKVTVTVLTSQLTSIDICNAIIGTIDTIFDSFKITPYKKIYVKLQIIINDDKIDNDTFIAALKQAYSYNKLVRVEIKNKLNKKRREIEKKKHSDVIDKFGFVMEPKNGVKEISELLSKFIKVTKDVEIPPESISNVISEFMK